MSRPRVSKAVTTAVRPFGPRLPHWITGRIPVVREFEIAVPGTSRSLRMQTDSLDISALVFWRGWQAWEPMLARALVELAPRQGHFFDVGANVGLTTLLVAAASPSTRVHAFEPVPDIFGRLERNRLLNPDLTNVVTHQLALSDVAGEAVIHVPVHNWGRVSTEASLQPRSQKSTDVSVPVDTLDNFVRDHGIDRVGLLKLDTEGTEHWVLQGATATLDRDRPFVICEVLADSWPQPHLGPIFFGRDYRAVHLRQSGPELCHEVRGDPTDRDLDFLFVPSERWAALPGWLQGTG